MKVSLERAKEPRAYQSYLDWNKRLHAGAQDFYTKHPNITALMYSSWDIFDKVYNEPTKFGFSRQDLRKRGGAIWMDHLHPTSRMHEVVATDLEAFLKAFPAHVEAMRTEIESNAEP